MPRTPKGAKFYIYKERKSGPYKGKKLLGVTNTNEDLTLEDFLQFVREQGLRPDQVALPQNFVTYAKVT